MMQTTEKLKRRLMISLMTAASCPKIEKSDASPSITIIVNRMLINKPVYDR